MSSVWRAKQFGDTVDRFKVACQRDAWEDILLAYGILRDRGPQCGDTIAKKLVNGKGLWELIGRAGNIQVRLLFYFDDTERDLIIFLLAFTKTGGKKDYKPAIETALSRRSLIKRRERVPNVISAFDSTNRH